MENESLGKLSVRGAYRERSWMPVRATSPFIPGYNLSRGEGRVRAGVNSRQIFRRTGLPGEETFAFMPRTWQPEKPRSSDRNTTTMRHVSSSSSPFSSFPRVSRHGISRDGWGTQCLHYDARKTNLEKFLWCIRCLTSRWLRWRNCTSGWICSVKIRFARYNS